MRRRETRSGFTLVELLVCVGIIAALTAILLPVLASARENGRKATCSSNLRQLGIAFAQYVSDYDGHYPDSMAYEPLPGVPGTWDVLLLPYSKDMRLLQCPSDGVSSRFDLPGLGEGLYRSYTLPYNFSKAADATQRTTTFETFIPRPASTVLLTERESNSEGLPNRGWIFGHYCENLGADVAWRHNGGANFLYADGHVRSSSGARKGAFPRFDGYTYTPDRGALCGDGDPLPR